MKITNAQLLEIMRGNDEYDVELEVEIHNENIKFQLECSEMNGLEYFTSDSSEAELYNDWFSDAETLVKRAHEIKLIEYKCRK